MYEQQAPYLEHGIKRYETLFGQLTPVIDVSHYIRDIRVPSHKDLVFFQLNKVLPDNSLFLGFGKPNVYLGIPSENGGYDKFDAKSLKRAESKIIDTRNFVQSGLIFLIHTEDIEQDHVRETIHQRVRQAAEKESGTKSWTCVNANAKVLEEAGFDFGLSEDMPSKYYFPMPLARRILCDGIQCRGKKLRITVIRTVPSYLEDFGLSVIKSQWLTLNRHMKRFVGTHAKWVYGAFSSIKNRFFKKKKEDSIEEFVSYRPSSHSSGNSVLMTISYPSKKGTFFRWLWGPHSFFTIKLKESGFDTAKIDSALPDSIKEYEAKSGTLFNFIKQNVLFNKYVVNFILDHLAKNESKPLEVTEDEVFNLLRTHSEEKPHKYNIVVTGEQIRVMKLGIKYQFIDWIMSKHILASGYSNDVRYAGEVWKTKEGVICISNDSGTYAPTNEMLTEIVKLLNELFPSVQFETKKAY
jgi:hypothetical protein